MERSEFLAQLRRALEHDLDAKQIKEQIDYYDDYIRSEVDKGLSEEEVISQLGDPWAIAKTVRLSSRINSQESETSSSKVDKVRGGKQANIFWAIVLVLVFVVVVSAAFGIIALAIRFAVPILLIIILIRLFRKE